MKPEDRIKELTTQADGLRRKALESPDAFTQADADRTTAIVKEHSELTSLVERQKATADALYKAGSGAPTQSAGGEGSGDISDSGRGRFSGRGGVPITHSEKTRAYTAQVMKAFELAAPSIGGPHVQKALVPSGHVTADFDGRVVHDPRAVFSILAAISSRVVDTPAGTYLRQNARTNNAATVAAGELKPISVYGLEKAEWHMATIATLTEPVANQWLADYVSLEQFIAEELAYGLDSATSDFVLNGGTDEDGGAVTGILNTTGIQETSFTSSKVMTIRRAIGELDTAGVTATGIILNPADWESIETLLTANAEFLLPLAPQRSAERLLWGTPVTLAPGMPAGQAIVGDLSTVSLLYRPSQLIEWNPWFADIGGEGTPSPTDMFRRNQVVFRAEVRVALEILSTKTLRIADLTA